jgi:hypothetical protein
MLSTRRSPGDPPLNRPKNIMVYGSDAAEIVHGSDALLKLLTADQRLWGGSARFGAMEHVSLVQNHSFASIFFDVSFSAGGRPPVPVRVAAIWKREGNIGFSYRVQMRSLPNIRVQLSCFNIRVKWRRPRAARLQIASRCGYGRSYESRMGLQVR